ncbi:HEAT repeat domain-containing protein, partial [bacterium]|nr:HEAT repeat domain-containing protein [bacterium]
SLKALKNMDQALLKRILFRMSDSHQAPYQLAILKVIDQLTLSYGPLLLRKLSSSEFDEVFDQASIMLKTSKFEDDPSILSESLEEAWGIEEVDTLELNLEYEVIVTTIQNSSDEKQIASCLAQLSSADIGNNQKQRLLDSFVSHADPRVRANAVEGLRLIWDLKERSYFLNFLNDKNNRVLGNAVIALGESTCYQEDYHQSVFSVLENMLDRSEPEFQSTALYCIGLLEYESYLVLVEKQLQKSDQVHNCLILLENWSKGNVAAKELLQNFHKELTIEKQREKEPVSLSDKNEGSLELSGKLVSFAELKAKVTGWEKEVLVKTAIATPRKKLSDSKVRYNPKVVRGLLGPLNYCCDQCNKKVVWAGITMFGYRYCSHECKLKFLGEPEFCKFCDFLGESSLEKLSLEKGPFGKSMMFQGEPCLSCGSQERTLTKQAIFPLFPIASYKVFQISETEYLTKRIKLNISHALFAVSPILVVISLIAFFLLNLQS